MIDIILEIVFDLIFEGTTEIIKNKKISKIIRYPLVIFITIIMFSIILGVGFVGIMLLIRNQEKYDLISGIAFIIIDILFIYFGSKNIKNEIIRRSK